MGEQMNNAAPVASGPIIKELAETRRNAVVDLLTGLKARITAWRIAFLEESDVLTENTSREVDIPDYAGETDLYRIDDDVEYVAAHLRPVDDLDVFMPVCVIKRLTGSAGGDSHILDTTVYRIETGAYIRDAVMPLVEAFKTADEAIECATADYLTALGVGIEKNFVCDPENDGGDLSFVKLGEVTAQDYARCVRLCDAGQIASASISRTWRHTPAGWLVTYEASGPTGKEYCYEFLA